MNRRSLLKAIPLLAITPFIKVEEPKSDIFLDSGERHIRFRKFGWDDDKKVWYDLAERNLISSQTLIERFKF